MIPHGRGFIARHIPTGRYLATHSSTSEAWRDNYGTVYLLIDNPLRAIRNYAVSAFPPFKFMDREGWDLVADQFESVPHPGCGCCGASDILWSWVLPDKRRIYRCEKHKERNPCAVDGCMRTRAVHGGRIGDDQCICAEHWRMFVPPGSRLRRAYLRFFRIEKKTGWTMALERRYQRFWCGLVRRVRAGSAGDLDMKEINAMFGWEE
jgi:hypothetical protein